GKAAFEALGIFEDSKAANTHQGPGSEIAQNEPGYISASMLYRSSNCDCRRWADHTFAYFGPSK
ncbi:hypothetical protein K4M07_16665, partial [Pseudomonas syringae pv. tomato]|uniref:hypothetical protein n=2 Tax=Pseudomonas syringae group genomosp. 3 TaxID=251701 RepID=UPI001C82AE9A